MLNKSIRDRYRKLVCLNYHYTKKIVRAIQKQDQGNTDLIQRNFEHKINLQKHNRIQFR